MDVLEEQSWVESAAKIFANLGYPDRIRILILLHQHPELMSGEIAERLEMSPSRASRHLKPMFYGGLIAKRRRSNRRYYSLGDGIGKDMLNAVCKSLGVGFGDPDLELSEGRPSAA